MQPRYNIEDDDVVKLSLTYIRKMQNTAKIEVLAIDKMALSTKIIIGEKGLDISVKKV